MKIKKLGSLKLILTVKQASRLTLRDDVAEEKLDSRFVPALRFFVFVDLLKDPASQLRPGIHTKRC